MKCPECGGAGKVVHPMMSMNGDEYTGEWEQHECETCNGTGEVQMTNFENIAKNADTLAKWLSDKIHFCREVPCDECKINCANDDVNVTNADLWSAWLKQPHSFK